MIFKRDYFNGLCKGIFLFVLIFIKLSFIKTDQGHCTGEHINLKAYNLGNITVLSGEVNKVICLNDDIINDELYVDDSDVTYIINGNGYKIKSLAVDKGTVILKNVVLTGGNQVYGLIISNAAKVIIGEGVCVKGVYDENYKDNPCVVVEGGSTLTIEDGAVIDAKEIFSGTGVTVIGEGSTLNINGGTIIGGGKKMNGSEHKEYI